jgi:hypothetical protein
MTLRRRPGAVVAAIAAATLCLVTALTACAADDGRVDLARIVAGWPDQYAVSGTKAEPLYTERIHADRDGDLFRVRIEVLGQGDAALGTQHSSVRVGADGTVVWVDGCEKAAGQCASDTDLRGFLATAALVGLARAGRLPQSATVREFHGTSVLCVDDAALHPDAAPATVTLDPCFDRTSGAVLAHWSPESRAFVGATLAPGFAVTSGAP